MSNNCVRARLDAGTFLSARALSRSKGASSGGSGCHDPVKRLCVCGVVCIYTIIMKGFQVYKYAPLLCQPRLSCTDYFRIYPRGVPDSAHPALWLHGHCLVFNLATTNPRTGKASLIFQRTLQPPLPAIKYICEFRVKCVAWCFWQKNDICAPFYVR